MLYPASYCTVHVFVNWFFVCICLCVSSSLFVYELLDVWRFCRHCVAAICYWLMCIMIRSGAVRQLSPFQWTGLILRMTVMLYDFVNCLFLRYVMFFGLQEIYLRCRRRPRSGDRKRANLLAGSLAHVVPGPV